MYFVERQLLLSIVNLFGAGTETTSTTLTWGIVFLLENPEVYAKLQKEIDGVLGERLFPALEDKGRSRGMQLLCTVPYVKYIEALI